MGLPVPEHRPGDCYVWGSCEPRSSGSPILSPVCSSAVTCSPILVSESSHLDVCEVWLPSCHETRHHSMYERTLSCRPGISRACNRQMCAVGEAMEALDLYAGQCFGLS